MQSKLQELTEKIYQEGVSKGNEEAQAIIEQANTDAAQIIERAQAEANKIIEEATKKAKELQSNTVSEIKLSSKQAISALKQSVTDLVNGEIVKASVGKTVNSSDFVKELLKTMFSGWATNKSSDFVVSLPETKKADFDSFVKTEAKSLLDKGLKVEYSKNIKDGFQISPSDGAYKMSFTDEDFQNLFKLFIRPKLTEFLFDTE